MQTSKAPTINRPMVGKRSYDINLHEFQCCGSPFYSPLRARTINQESFEHRLEREFINRAVFTDKTFTY